MIKENTTHLNFDERVLLGMVEEIEKSAKKLSNKNALVELAKATTFIAVGAGFWLTGTGFLGAMFYGLCGGWFAGVVVSVAAPGGDVEEEGVRLARRLQAVLADEDILDEKTKKKINKQTHSTYFEVNKLLDLVVSAKDTILLQKSHKNIPNPEQEESVIELPSTDTIRLETKHDERFVVVMEHEKPLDNQNEQFGVEDDQEQERRNNFKI